MSDAPQGPDWWQASDDRWYPPPRPPAPGEDPTIQQIEPQVDPTLVHPGAVPPVAPPNVSPPTPPPQAVVPPTVPPPQAAPYAPPNIPTAGPGGPGVPPPGASPYGAPSPFGTPVQPPRGTSQTRTPLIITLAVVIVLAIAAAVVVASGDDDETADPTTTGASVPGSSTTGGDDPSTTGGGDSSTTTGGGGEPETEVPYSSGHEDLEIVDQGFSISADEGAGGDTLSYGAIIENNSDRVAVICSIVVEFTDEEGSNVLTHDQSWLSAILPGESFGIGISQLTFRGEPAAMHVELGSISYDDPERYGDITVDVADTTMDSYGRPTTSYSAESSYDDELPEPFAWVVHRNADGDIVGGDGAYMDAPLVPGEPVDDEVTTRGAIADADESRAEVWIEPVTTDCQTDQPGEPV